MADGIVRIPGPLHVGQVIDFGETKVRVTGWIGDVTALVPGQEADRAVIWVEEIKAEPAP